MTVKICHVTSAHSTDDVRILKKECTSLAKDKNYNVYLVGRGENWEYKGVHIIGVGDVPGNRMQRMTKFAKKVIDKAIQINADVYHLHDPELLRFAIKLKKMGKKVIFDSHENILDSIDEKKYMPIILRKIFKIYYRKIEKKILPKINGIVVVTSQMIDVYNQYNSNIVLVTNYPIISDYINEKESNSKTIKGRFIFAGGITEQWSHREIIKALSEIEGVEYYLFGNADIGYLEELKKLDGWKKVNYGGKISYEEVQNEIAKAQFVFALAKPSKNSFYYEGTLGNTKLFEAMKSGKPVIATNFELWKPIVEGNKCGICVNPNDGKAIKKAINELLELSQEEYRIMGQNCKNTIYNELNWDVVEKILCDFYESIVY